MRFPVFHQNNKHSNTASPKTSTFIFSRNKFMSALNSKPRPLSNRSLKTKERQEEQQQQRHVKKQCSLIDFREFSTSDFHLADVFWPGPSDAHDKNKNDQFDTDCFKKSSLLSPTTMASSSSSLPSSSSLGSKSSTILYRRIREYAHSSRSFSFHESSSLYSAASGSPLVFSPLFSRGCGSGGAEGIVANNRSRDVIRLTV